MRTLPLLALPLSLAACTMGPDYAGPPVTPSRGAGAGFARATDAVQPAAVPAVTDWWTALRDPQLDALEQRALAANPSIAVAQARVRQARGALRLERANRLPSANASGSYLHAELPGIDLGSLTEGSGESGTPGTEAGESSGGGGSTGVDFFNLGFDASWEIDLFGRQRRTVEAARAAAVGAEANLADAQVQLTAEVAQTYVALRDRQARIALSQRSSEMQRRILRLTEERYARGTVSALDVERLRLQVENTDAELVPLNAEVASYLNALAVLVGEAPGTLDAELRAAAPIPLVPAQVAVGDPASLLQRRPDIRAAERQLASRTARIGVAEAARFPSLSLQGMLGLGGTSISDVVDPDNLVALATPMLRWNFLDFGRGRARVEQAQGERDEAEAKYRQAVLGALRDAEDALARYGARRQTLASLVRAKASADRASALMDQRFRAGTATLIDTLDVERQRVSAEQQLSVATAGLTTDYVALQKALGLGWAAPKPAAP
ncbi:efflux transporter outer membrane subunit [Sphingomonas desiccabilis]|uniref:Efflux transporter outer membrane subunit n=1 Tax=Sphingomonas desiccabilis TaxID=429134 RepID=A0A4Q2J0T2_9SPHN|nr:efflux transporter outer membrane subunit [Sphingomonas desiccabilis]MBB3910704.1 NodT family efflux transporter outer membrane factor (OMF) lipoprotein [Sphingomonas desiccabilis]RXZ35323.1 efflux transporter outer membrane subunit [Sphingomonas desiccabilis]